MNRRKDTLRLCLCAGGYNRRVISTCTQAQPKYLGCVCVQADLGCVISTCTQAKPKYLGCACVQADLGCACVHANTTFGLYPPAHKHSLNIL